MRLTYYTVVQNQGFRALRKYEKNDCKRDAGSQLKMIQKTRAPRVDFSDLGWFYERSDFGYGSCQSLCFGSMPMLAHANSISSINSNTVLIRSVHPTQLIQSKSIHSNSIQHNQIHFNVIQFVSLSSI